MKSNKPYMHMDLTGPALGFVDLAKGMGVAGTHVTKADDIQAPSRPPSSPASRT